MQFIRAVFACMKYEQSALPTTQLRFDSTSYCAYYLHTYTIHMRTNDHWSVFQISAQCGPIT